MRPALPFDAETFLPQGVPAYAAAEMMTLLRKKYPEYAYKEATLNPTNPRNRAVEWETDIVNTFRNDNARIEITGIRETPTGPSLYLARPFQIKDQACLACHTTPDMSPPAIVKIYGTSNGYGWKHMEVVGAQIVSMPMSLPIQNANRAFYTFIAALTVVFVSQLPQPAQSTLVDSRLAEKLSTTSLQRFDDETLRRAETSLAQYIGAVAKVVVKRAAGKARDEGELYLLLADEIDDKTEKRKFIRKAISVSGKP